MNLNRRVYQGRIQAFRPAGFSLIELLVVLALTAVLVMLLVHAVSSVRDSSHQAACVSNLRSLAAGAMAYSAENDGQLPDRALWQYGPGNAYSLAPYLDLPVDESGQPLEVDTVLTCPAIQHSGGRVRNQGWHRTYSINQYATGSDFSGSGVGTWPNHVQARGVPENYHRVAQPSRMAFFMDGTGQPTASGYRYSAFQAPDRMKAERSGWHTWYVHGDRINVVFMDGHVEAIDLAFAQEELIGPTNPSASQAHTSPRTHPFWGASQ